MDGRGRMRSGPRSPSRNLLLPKSWAIGSVGLVRGLFAVGVASGVRMTLGRLGDPLAPGSRPTAFVKPCALEGILPSIMPSTARLTLPPWFLTLTQCPFQLAPGFLWAAIVQPSPPHSFLALAVLVRGGDTASLWCSGGAGACCLGVLPSMSPTAACVWQKVASSCSRAGSAQASLVGPRSGCCESRANRSE